MLTVKVKLDRSNPEIETVNQIWRTAELNEREVYDLFGVKFLHHPDLRRILLTDDWEGWPLRKDYEDPVNIIKL
jgi:NADH:ubiquinone oxidoreductase subunit C